MPAVRTTKKTQSPGEPSIPACSTASYPEVLGILGVPVNWLDTADHTVYQFETVAPGKPIPRAPNAFMAFLASICKIRREQKQHERTPMQQPQVTKLCGQLWRSAPQNVRTEFADRANVAVANHKLKYPDYKFSPKSQEDKKMQAAEKGQVTAASAEKVKGSGVSTGGRRNGGKGKGKANTDSDSPPLSSTTLDPPPSSHHATVIPNFFPGYSSWSYSEPPPMPLTMSSSSSPQAGLQLSHHSSGESRGKGKARDYTGSNEPSSFSSPPTLGSSSHHATMPQPYHYNSLLGPSYPIPSASSSDLGHFARPLHDVHNTHFNKMQHQSPYINPHHSLGVSIVPQLSGMGSYMSPAAQYEHLMQVYQYNSDRGSGGSKSSLAGDEYPVEEEPLSPSIQYLSFDYRNSQKSLDDVPLGDLDIPYMNPTHYDTFTLNSTESANHFTNGLTSRTPSLSQFGNPNLNPSRSVASSTNCDSNLNAGRGLSMRDLHTQNAGFDSSDIFDYATTIPSPVPQSYDAAPVASGSESVPMAVQESFVDLLNDAIVDGNATEHYQW